MNIKDIIKNINEHETIILNYKKNIVKYFNLDLDLDLENYLSYNFDICDFSEYYWKLDKDGIYYDLNKNFNNEKFINFSFYTFLKEVFSQKENNSIGFMTDGDENHIYFFIILDNSKKI